MIPDSSLAFLKRLLDTPGPSGFESAPARVWREEARGFAHQVRGDVAGNSIATIGPGGGSGDTSGAHGPVIMLAGHVDEIGVIVTYVDDDGYVYFSGIGGDYPSRSHGVPI